MSIYHFASWVPAPSCPVEINGPANLRSLFLNHFVLLHTGSDGALPASPRPRKAFFRVENWDHLFPDANRLADSVSCSGHVDVQSGPAQHSLPCVLPGCMATQTLAMVLSGVAVYCDSDWFFALNLVSRALSGVGSACLFTVGRYTQQQTP